MKRGLALLLVFMLLIPLAYSLSLKELISKYVFSASTAEMEVISYSDYMFDKTENGINDTMVIELLANNANGNFIFVVNLFDKNSAIVNESNLTLNSGANKVNLTFDSSLLSQNQFNYSIKVYNSSYSLKYRKDKILTQNYSNYEEGFKFLDAKDAVSNNNIQINITINSTKNGTYESILFLAYNDSIISIKENKTLDGISVLSFNLDNQTIKRTHYSGSFNISSLKIGRKVLRIGSNTNSYDFRNFASSSYFDDFSDSGYDSNNNEKYESLNIVSNLQILNEGYYSSVIYLYDIFDNLVEIKNSSSYLFIGKRALQFDINGSRIQKNKLSGPYVIKRAELFENGNLIDALNNAHTTNYYNFNDFDKYDLPDLSVNISVSPDYHYGINNLTVNFSFKNIGNKPAFNVFTEIFSNFTFSKINKSNVLNSNSELRYQLILTNTSDFEITAFADSNDLIEESSENNNAEKLAIKINKKPHIGPISNFTVNETDKVLINLSAFDENGDSLAYSINSSKFTNKSNIFEYRALTTDSGNFTFEAKVSDGYLNDSGTFNLIILDNPEKDADNDGINDTIDAIIGDEKSINTSTLNITIFLNESGNLSRPVNGVATVKISDGNLTIGEFDFDFSANKLNLTNITINKGSSNSTGSIIFSGLSLPFGSTKSLYLDRLDASLNGICIRDESIVSISEITNNCDSNSEFSIECDGTLQNGYSCSYNSTLNKYKVKGLRHSGIMQYDYSKPVSNAGSSGSISSASSGGSGGGASALAPCTSNWKCGEWSSCADGISARKCEDMGKCQVQTNKPQLTQPCGNKSKTFYLNFSFKDENYGNQVNDGQESNKPPTAAITGSAIKQVSLHSYAGAFIALILVLFVGGFYLNKKYRILLKIFK